MVKVWLATFLIYVAIIVASTALAIAFESDPNEERARILSLFVSFLLAERFFGRYDD